MGASRETCDLFWILRLAKKYPDNKKYYYDRFWYVIKHQRKLMFEDTFLPFWCKIVGHKKYTPDSDNPVSFVLLLQVADQNQGSDPQAFQYSI